VTASATEGKSGRQGHGLLVVRLRSVVDPYAHFSVRQWKQEPRDPRTSLPESFRALSRAATGGLRLLVLA
jgi:hypothetical protein